MNSQDKSQEEILSELKKAEFEIQELKKAESEQKRIIDSLYLGQHLYMDLANALPSGIYRTRVFSEMSLIENNWLKTKEIPYDIEFANDRFFEILHLDRAVYEKNPGILHDMIFEADKVEFVKKNVESNLHKTPFCWEGRLFINNEIIWVCFKSIPRILENGDIIWTGTLDDITQRKLIEQEIQTKNAELQKLIADKDLFMAILAHDLKSPFNSILGFLNLLTNNLREYDIDEIESQISFVNNSAQSVFNLLDSILIWSHSQSGKIPFEPKAFDFQSCCDGVINLLKQNADNKNITIHGGDEKIIVFADIDMFNTILRNLISNAIIYTHNGGHIDIFAQKCDTAITIVVSDNGIGIAPDKLSKLFEYTQMRSTKGTADEKGTGFGLMICKEFVEKHGGKIWVNSEPGKGSQFKFTIPLRKK